MATKRKTHAEKIANVLMRYNANPGVTPMQVSKRAGVPLESVYKRVSDLRNEFDIYTNTRMVNGRRTSFYRMAV